MKIKLWELALITAFAVTVLCGFIVSEEQEELADTLVRLHVVANSDTEEDQALKLKVRDEIIRKLEKSLDTAESREEALEVIRESIPELETAAERVVFENGFDYGVEATVAVEDFPTREYESFSLPAGSYTALRVKIGDAEGKNWWCVMFPPLCTEAATAEDFENMGLTESQRKLITENGDGYVIRFKLMEILAELRAIFLQ